MSRKNILVAVPLLFVFLTTSGPTGMMVRAQETKQRGGEESQAEPKDADEPEEQETPTPPTPPARPQPGVRGRPPVATPERRLVPPPSASRAEMVSLNFNGANLIEVIHVLAQHLKLTYTIDPEVKGTVTINSAEPLRKDDLMPIFHQILRMNDAVAIKTGDLYRIAPIAKGKGLARPAGPDNETGYAIQVVPVRFFSVAEMKRLLAPFVTPGGEVLDFPRGNFLMIVDLPSNVQRLMEIRDVIDVQTFVGTRTEIYQPKVASADELAAEMTKVMQSYASSASQAEGFAAQFLSIPRINQLLVVADSEAAWVYVRRWLERLDTIGEGPGRRIHIYPVENSKAVDLADVLTQVLGISGGPRREQGRTLEQLHRGTSGAAIPTTPGLLRQPGTGFGTFGGQPSTMGGINALAPAQQQPQPGAPPPQTTTRPPAGRPDARPDARQQEAKQEELRIVADQTTNTLIIFGTAQEFQNIKNILKDLDIPPRQVVLECLVAEVKLSGSNSLGFDYQGLLGLRKGGRFTGDFSTTTTSTTDGTTTTTVVPGPQVFGSTGIAALVGSNNVRGLVTALQSNDRSKILASPTILATDNQPARIQVGDEIPIATGSLTALAGATTSDLATATTIQSRNTGKILTIIPQVNSKGLVNLQLKVEVSKQGGNVVVGNQQTTFPSFSTRDVETTAVVKDGETLVIGGIFSEDRSNGRSGVPYLMDIPVFGWFFRKTTDTLTERTELIILITPRVIRDVDESRRVTDEFREKLRTVAGEIERMRRGGARDDLPPPKVEPLAPEKESRVIPEIIGPENSAAGGREAAIAETSVRKWTVQVDAYPDELSSRMVVRRLKQKGYDPYVLVANVKGRDWYRVRVGRFATRREAKELLEELQSKEKFTMAMAVSR
jgi:general secretion pathway protein D